MIVYLFDIDGTILQSNPGASGRVAFDTVFERAHGVGAASAGIRYGGKTDGGIIDEIYRARLGRPPTAVESAAFIDAYLPLLTRMLGEHGVTVLPGVIDALDWLATRSDVLLGVATGNVREGAGVKLAAAGLGAWFERAGAVGGYGCDSTVRAELVARAIERAKQQCAPREVIVVGDTIHDISAARACGATVVAVATGADPADALRDADAVLATMAELPAWHVARYGADP